MRRYDKKIENHLTATDRAERRWKKILSQYAPPALEAAIQKKLQDFVEK